MLFKQLAFAASAAAFLLVPEIAEPEEDVFKALPIEPQTFELPATAFTQAIDVPCSECKGKGTNLHFDIVVKDGKTLMANDFELYSSNGLLPGELTASISDFKGKTKEEKLGFYVAVVPKGVDEALATEVILIELRVLEVGTQFIDTIPAIDINVIKAANGDLLIGSIELKEITRTECDSMWCRTKATVDKLFKGVKGCGGRHKAHKGPKGHGSHASADGAEGHRAHKGHHEHGAHRHHRHHFGKLIKDITIHALLPIVMGVAAGAVVALYVPLSFSFILSNINRILVSPCSYLLWPFASLRLSEENVSSVRGARDAALSRLRTLSMRRRLVSWMIRTSHLSTRTTL